MEYTSLEKETVGLCICIEALNEIINFGLLEIRDVSVYPGEAEIYFHSSTEKQLFLIRFLDFVSEKGNNQLVGINGTCLSILESACEIQAFNNNNSISPLKESLEKLKLWLDEKTDINFWLPSIGKNVSLNVSRQKFLFISGNQSKHNLTRLNGVISCINTILEEHGYHVDQHQIPFVLEDFRDHLQDNYFIYYGTWITELLNNIRWDLHHYLLPTFNTCYKKSGTDDFSYTYEYPTDIKNDIFQQWFWRLMNNIRMKPYLKKFVGARYLKEKSSLEFEE